MSIRIICPECRATNEVPDDLRGKKIRCRRCDEVLVAPRRRRPKGNLSPLAIVAATFSLLVIVIGGIIGAYFIFGHSPAPQGDGPAPPPDHFGPFGPGERFLMERQPQLEAWFRTPEEPPSNRLTFAEPPDEPAARQGAGPAEPIRNATGQLAPEVLQRIKEATVYIHTQSHSGEASGSGFLAGEPGFVVTNAHVVFMLDRTAPPPTSIKVVRNKGEKNEVTLTAQLVAVDPEEDLAVLSVPKKDLPTPMTVRSAQRLQETQPVYVAGFPLGERVGKNVTINKYELSSLKKDKDGALDRLQVHGDMVFGNSGGPVLDADGDVVGVCVSIVSDPRVATRINFAIPGDKVLRFLSGRLADLTLETPAEADGRLRVPAAVKLTDPLGRVGQVALEVWAGKPGPARPGSRTPPQPLPGDGPHEKLTVPVQKQAGRGLLTLPQLPEGQVCWLQPCLVSGASRVWLSAQVYQPPAPVTRKPARLAWEPAGEHPLVLERLSSLQYSDPNGQDHRALLALEARVTESARGRQGNDPALYRQFTGFKEGVSLDKELYMTTRLQQIGPNIQYLADNLVTDAQGTTRRDDFDPKLGNAPTAAKRHLMGFQQEMTKLFQGLEVPMPGKEVKPGETWKGHRPLPIDAGWKLIDGLPPQIWASHEAEFMDVTYTYAGLRTVNGAERAVIQLKGQPVQQPGAGAASGATFSGTATVDPATGQVVEQEVTTQANAEFILFNTAAFKAQGTVVVRLRRE
jgi:S1-C subfamily serine protease